MEKLLVPMHGKGCTGKLMVELWFREFENVHQAEKGEWYDASRGVCDDAYG